MLQISAPESEHYLIIMGHFFFVFLWRPFRSSEPMTNGIIQCTIKL
jgi:hypothetical protein